MTVKDTKAKAVFVAALVVTGLILSACQPQVVVEERIVIQEKEVLRERKSN